MSPRWTDVSTGSGSDRVSPRLSIGYPNKTRSLPLTVLISASRYYMTTKKSAAPRKKTAKQKSQTAPCPTARKTRMPDVIQPMLATLVDDPFSDPDWIFETKWDGFRSVCFVRDGQARFVSRNQIEMTPQYPELVNVAGQLDAKEAILDGEIVALDEN